MTKKKATKSVTEQIKTNKENRGKKKDLRVKKQALKPTRSYEQLIAEENRKALEPFIQGTIQNYFGVMKQSLEKNLDSMYLRIMALEKIAMKEFGLTQGDLSNKVSDLEDELSGVESVTDAVKKGDLVRLNISTKKLTDKEFSKASDHMMIDVGNPPFAIAKEVEESVIGMKVGETKSTSFGEKEKKVVTKLTIDRISRKKEEKIENKNDKQ